MTTSQPRIGFAGMTHLGLNSAAASAEKGFQTLCFDPDAALTDRLRVGELPVQEPDLNALLTTHADRIEFTNDAAAMQRCDVVYVAPDVSTDDRGESDFTAIEALLQLAFAHAAADATLVVLSQVPPGFTRRHLAPSRQLFYQVETLIFGRAVERALFPERVIIGCADPEAALPDAYQNYLNAFDCPLLPMRLESAELAKISINCCLVASISAANTLAAVCEGIGADWSEIAPALKLDKRIGEHAYLKPGLGIAGGNLERDLHTVIKLGRSVAADVGVVEAWGRNSRRRRDWALGKIHDRVLPANIEARICVLGLAYKENTHSTKNSPGLALVRHLAPYQPIVYDPVVPLDAVDGLDVRIAASAMLGAENADALAIMTPWAEFASLDPQALRHAMTGNVIVDPYAVLNGADCISAGFEYHTLGKSISGSDEVRTQ
jgi:UDPglucose 6-dehydrogenase